MISYSTGQFFSSIKETEQYLCLDRETASSTALRLNLPRTAYVSLMWVKMRGGAAAWVATAETISPVSSWRFFMRMLTTSTEVQLHRAISTASIGLGPCLCAESPSSRMVLPCSVLPSKTSSCFHSL